MIDLGNLAGTHYAIMGLDKSGLPAVRALLAAGAQVTAWDDNADKRTAVEALGARISELTSCEAAHFQALILTPGIPHQLPQPHPVAAHFAAAQVPIICDIELFARTTPRGRLIGITGTDGKSTTTALITHILQQAGRHAVMAGNIGTSPLALDAADYTVLELSSYQLERCPSLQLDVAICLNLTRDHLERHGDMDGYAAAKANIFKQPRPGALAICGSDDAYTVALGQQAQRHGFTLHSIVRPADGIYKGIDLAQLPTLRGAHNWQNAIAAIECALHLGLSLPEIEQGLRSYPGLPHRQQKVGQQKVGQQKIGQAGLLTYINDSKATNANATSKALGSFNNIYWIAGGQPKVGGLSGLESWVPRIRKAYLIGQAQDEFATWCAANQLPFALCGTLDQATRQASHDAQAALSAQPGEATILLSPACASWDQFKSYEHRGETFAALVSALLQPEAKSA